MRRARTGRRGRTSFRGTGRVVSDVAEYRQVGAAVMRKYRLLGPLLNAWSKVSGLFGSHAAETAVAWSIDEVV